MNKYFDSVMEAVRGNLGLDFNDESMDEEINSMTRQEVFDRVCDWHGLINYGDTLREWVENIWGIDLDEVVARHEKEYND